MRDPCRLVLLAPVGNRREVRAVGLNEHPVHWAHGRGSLDIWRTLECDDARERQVGADVEAALGFLGAAREAVQDGPRRDPLSREDVERVGPGIAGMDHQRQVVLVGELDLLGKCPLLELAR